MLLEGEFFLCATGSIECAEFYEIDNAYCKYGYHFGPDWSVVAGIEEGLTQMSKCSNDIRRLIVWNFPLDITFRSTTPHGWPQLVLSIYGSDFFGHDVIKGYGVCHLPLTNGRHEKRISVYALESSSPMQRFAAWLTGRRPELIEPSILASAAGRESAGQLFIWSIIDMSVMFDNTTSSDSDGGAGDGDNNIQRSSQGFFQGWI